MGGRRKGGKVLVEVLGAPPAELQSAHLRPCQLPHMREQQRVSEGFKGFNGFLGFTGYN